jgi:hypothetical protein
MFVFRGLSYYISILLEKHTFSLPQENSLKEMHVTIFIRLRFTDVFKKVSGSRTQEISVAAKINLKLTIKHYKTKLNSKFFSLFAFR